MVVVCWLVSAMFLGGIRACGIVLWRMVLSWMMNGEQELRGRAVKAFGCCIRKMYVGDEDVATTASFLAPRALSFWLRAPYPSTSQSQRPEDWASVVKMRLPFSSLHGTSTPLEPGRGPSAKRRTLAGSPMAGMRRVALP